MISLLPSRPLPCCQRSAGGRRAGAGPWWPAGGATNVRVPLTRSATAPQPAPHRLAVRTHTPPIYRVRHSPTAAAPRGGEAQPVLSKPVLAKPHSSCPVIASALSAATNRVWPRARVSRFNPGLFPRVGRVLVWLSAAGAFVSSSPIHEHHLRSAPCASAVALLSVAVAVRKLLKPPVRQGAERVKWLR